jgi:hypothetical protein
MGHFAFSTISDKNLASYGLVHKYARLKDPFYLSMGPALYYINASARCFVNLMTRPGTLKYLGSYPLLVFGKILAYPWVVFWNIGVLAGLARVGRNVYLRAPALLLFYFVIITIAGASFNGERYRVPMVPFIAIISAAGWDHIVSRIRASGLQALRKPIALPGVKN